MFYVSKRMEIAGAHKLPLSYESPCQRVHGHNWIVTVFCASNELDQDGMIVDFAHIKRDIHGKLDHQFLNEVVDFIPTAENMAEWICRQVKNCYKVTVQESEGNVAMYILPGWEVRNAL